MDSVLFVLANVAGLVGFVCFVIVVIKMFQNDRVVLGILSIVTCFLGQFIALFAGWKNKEAWKLNKVMPLFTLALLVSLVSNGAWIYLKFTEPVNDTAGPGSEFGDLPEMLEITPDDTSSKPE